MSNRTLNLDNAIYSYLLAHTTGETPVQKKLREETSRLEWSQMQIAPEQGAFMAFMVKLLNARKILEVGVFTGYSSLSMAQALPNDGKLIACDNSREWTDIAHQYWQQAGVDHKIELILGDAVDTLGQILAAGHANSFDMVFIDADKTNYRKYYEMSLRLLVSGGLLMIDNTLWGGSVANPIDNAEDTRAIRSINHHLKEDRRVDICMLPIADGLTLVRKK